MTNLLTSPVSHDQLVSVFRNHPPRSPLPPLGSPRWREALTRPFAAPFVAEILRRASDPAELDAPLPRLTDELYRDFWATGVRLRFERLYFQRRRHLSRAAIALLATPADDALRPAFLRSFLDKLEAVFAEDSWALPAHVPDPSGRDARLIDLFAAETANFMAELLSVFPGLIPAGLQARIREKLHRDFFQNSLSTDFWWMLSTNNWNAVCHQGVLGAALAIEDDPEQLAALCLKAALHLPAFIEGFGDDGACSEGPAYWDYGFGWFALLNEQLETRSGGELSLFAGSEKIRRIAGYGPAMSLRDGHVVNFADSRSDAASRPSTLRYLGQTLDLPACLLQASRNYAHVAAHAPDCDFHRSDFLYWTRFLLYAPAAIPAPAPAPDAPAGTFYPSLGVWVTRARDRLGHTWELAAKGGHNDEHHNHNDVGNFLLHVDGRPIVAEIGMPEYNASYFSADRYTHLAARTLGHSLPLINGCEQSAGASFAGDVRRAAPSDSGPLVHFEAELASAYPAAAGCRSFVRRLRLDKDPGVCTWTDTLFLDSDQGQVASGFITSCEDIAIESPALLVIREAGLTLEFRIQAAADAAAPAAWTGIETRSCSMPDGALRPWRRAVLSAPAATRFSATVTISLRA